MAETSTTWKSLAAGFIFGVVSTGLYGLGLHLPGAVLWGLSVGYIGYKVYEAAHEK
jgi:hypothetical protein